MTPDIQPEKSLETRTPKRKSEWLPIMNRIRRVLPASHQLDLTRIEHYLDELEAQRTLLSEQIKLYRKDNRNKENQGSARRLKKLDEKIVTSFRDLMEARGGTEEEIELLDDQQPSVFKVQTDLVTRRGMQRRARRTAAKKAD